MQHLVAWTSEYAPLADNHGWAINGAGFKVRRIISLILSVGKALFNNH